MRSNRKKNWFIKRIALGLAIAAVAAPVAQARVDEGIQGERVGSVTVLVDGRRVRRVALVTADEVPGAGTLRVLLSDLGVPLTVLIVLAILVAAALALLRVRIRIRIAK